MTLNGKVVQESFPYGDTTIIMYFTYDEQGRPFSLLYSKNGGSSFDAYYYAINAQGDVEGIFFTRKNTETGKQEVRWMGYYTYDAWGNITSITSPSSTPGVPGDAVTNPANLMLRNPLRYRGYYYDSETGFYYLQSRYYDPANHRFVNADAAQYTANAGNLFFYCKNNPVNSSDFTGEAPWGLLPYWGYIHRAVQYHIITEYAKKGTILIAEQSILLSNGKTGRADLYHKQTHQIWEIKSCGPASLLAIPQLLSYTYGVIAGTHIHPIIGMMFFSGKFTIDQFTVVYCSVLPGVIVYDFWVTENGQVAPTTVPALSPTEEEEEINAHNAFANVANAYIPENTLSGHAANLIVVVVGGAVSGSPSKNVCCFQYW